MARISGRDLQADAIAVNRSEVLIRCRNVARQKLQMEVYGAEKSSAARSAPGGN